MRFGVFVIAQKSETYNLHSYEVLKAFDYKNLKCSELLDQHTHPLVSGSSDNCCLGSINPSTVKEPICTEALTALTDSVIRNSFDALSRPTWRIHQTPTAQAGVYTESST